VEPFASKPLRYFATQSAGVERLVIAAGLQLERLSQCERYQLATCLSTYLWYLTTLEEEEKTEETLMGVYDSFIDIVATGNVVLCLSILNSEAADTIAFILPAIAHYATKSSMETLGLEGQASYQGELVLSKLLPDRL